MDLERILALAQAVAVDTVAGEAEACDREARWPERSFRAALESGLGGLVVPPEHGGLGQGLSGLLRTCEVFGRHNASFALSFGMHHVGAAAIAAKATHDQAERYLRPIARGEHITTLALSEPGTGLHFWYPETTLERTEGGFHVTGTKSFVTNGGHADSYVVGTVADDPDAPPGLFSCVLVPREAEGATWDAPYDGFGMRGNAARTLHMDRLHVPARDLLGEVGDQTWYVFNVVAPYFLVAMSGTYLGIAQRAVDEAVAHLGARAYAAGSAGPAASPVVQHRLGRAWSRVQKCRQLLYWAAKEAETGGPQALPALCAAKADVAECAVDAANDAMTIGGGRTYRDGEVLPRLLRDARAAHVMSPTTDLLWTWTGRALLGRPLLED
ncbi:MAG TPA: acyl-CoA dehydrogenase family protein [Candidatus Thermoplasmatota archaeon]|nr:acyl-CoA dehydrogenase family protein [Candidatus Thermoplasmatota archaeon]